MQFIGIESPTFALSKWALDVVPAQQARPDPTQRKQPVLEIYHCERETRRISLFHLFFKKRGRGISLFPLQRTSGQKDFLISSHVSGAGHPMVGEHCFQFWGFESWYSPHSLSTSSLLYLPAISSKSLKSLTGNPIYTIVACQNLNFVGNFFARLNFFHFLSLSRVKFRLLSSLLFLGFLLVDVSLIGIDSDLIILCWAGLGLGWSWFRVNGAGLCRESWSASLRERPWGRIPFIRCAEEVQVCSFRWKESTARSWYFFCVKQISFLWLLFSSS